MNILRFIVRFCDRFLQFNNFDLFCTIISEWRALQLVVEKETNGSPFQGNPLFCCFIFFVFTSVIVKSPFLWFELPLLLLHRNVRFHHFTDALKETRKSCTGQAQCEVSAYARSCRRCVATSWQRADTAVTKLQISPLIVNGFKNGFHQWIQHIFLVVVEHKKFFFWKFFFGCTLPPCSG